MPHLPTDVTTEITIQAAPPPSAAAPGPMEEQLGQCGSCLDTYPDGQDCGRCATCDRCDTAVLRRHLVETVTGSLICAACRQTHYWCCLICSSWNRGGHRCANGCPDLDIDQDDGSDEDDEDEDPDEDDDPDEDEGDDDDAYVDGDGVYGYSYKPRPNFHGTGALFLGLELEVATGYGRRWEAADTARTWLGSLGYLKADDSIGGGFEIVTHPMTYPWAITHFPWPMLAALTGDGAQATTKTGLHVHLSRAGFTGPCHTYRWMKFIYRNQPAVTALARRDAIGWAAFHDDDRRAVKEYAKGRPGFNRYRAINTLNLDTFELRVFASSLDVEQVQAALGFAAASVEYTRDLTIDAIVHQQAWAWPAFTDWLTTRDEYAPLLAQVEALTCAC